MLGGKPETQGLESVSYSRWKGGDKVSNSIVAVYHDNTGISINRVVYNFDFNHDLIALPCSVSEVSPKRRAIMGCICVSCGATTRVEEVGFAACAITHKHFVNQNTSLLPHS